jgi:hypothetical protein
MGLNTSTCAACVVTKRIALFCVIPAPLGREADEREQAGMTLVEVAHEAHTGPIQVPTGLTGAIHMSAEHRFGWRG